MDWTNRNVLVTGAGGFIGSHLCEALLTAGANVTALIRYTSRSDWGNLEAFSADQKARLKVVAGNIEDSYFVSEQVRGNNVVFHLAALIGIPYSYSAPLSYVRTNVEGTLNVMEASRKHGVEKIIHTSTSEVYGSALYTPIDEKHPLQGQSPYSASKIAADKIAESYFLSFDLPVATVRPFNTFGPRQSARAIIPTIVIQALTQKEILLGALDTVRDLNFVKDTVRGFIKIAESDQTVGETINIGFGKGISMGKLVQTILSLMGCHQPVVSKTERMRPAKSEVYTLICDNKKAMDTVGWSPAFSLENALLETIQFITANQHLYKADQYTV